MLLGIIFVLNMVIFGGDGIVGVISVEYIGFVWVWLKLEFVFMVLLVMLVSSVIVFEQCYQVEQVFIKVKDVVEVVGCVKSEFLVMMSYEIRIFMNGVLGMLNLLLWFGLDVDQVYKVIIVKISVEFLLSLFNEILDFFKVDVGKFELEELDFDLCGLLGELVEFMVIRVQEKGLELVLDLINIE